MPKVLNYRVIIEQDEDGYFVASAPAIPGCYTQGDTYEEATKNIKEVIELCLAEAKENPDYNSRIDFENEQDLRFLGVTQVGVSV